MGRGHEVREVRQDDGIQRQRKARLPGRVRE